MAINPRTYIANDKIFPATLGTPGQVLAVNGAGDALEYVDNLQIEAAGTIKPWPSEVVPAGYYKCNYAVKKQADEPAIFAIIGTLFGGGTDGGVTEFNLPGLMGKHIRGWDDSAGVDLDVANRTNSGDAGVGDNVTGDHVGTNQAAATALPSNNFTTDSDSHTHAFATFPSGSGEGNQVKSTNAASGVGFETVNSDSHNHSVIGGGDLETNTVNVALMWIIKN